MSPSAAAVVRVRCGMCTSPLVRRDVAAGLDVRQTDVGHIQGLADHAEITAPDRSAFAASDFVVNCPIISMN